jgi:hypothetical protein
MVNGKWQMVNGKWQMGKGKLKRGERGNGKLSKIYYGSI